MKSLTHALLDAMSGSEVRKSLNHRYSKAGMTQVGKSYFSYARFPIPSIHYYFPSWFPLRKGHT